MARHNISSIAAKQRLSLAQGAPPWDSLLCVFVVKIPKAATTTLLWAYSVRPYTSISGIAPKEGQELIFSVSLW